MSKTRLAMAAVIGCCAVNAAAAASIGIGDRLEPFTLSDAQGTRVDLASSQGSKARVIIFFATRCPVSIAYGGRMAAIATDYMPRGVAFYGIDSNRDESAAEMTAQAQAHGFPFPVLRDDGNLQADRFGASVTPEAYVFDASWTLRYHGRIDNSRNPERVTQRDLKAAIDAVLSGQPVPNAETKAFGCTIKRVPQ
jgi:peroxiredoxin